MLLPPTNANTVCNTPLTCSKRWRNTSQCSGPRKPHLRRRRVGRRFVRANPKRWAPRGRPVSGERPRCLPRQPQRPVAVGACPRPSAPPRGTPEARAQRVAALLLDAHARVVQRQAPQRRGEALVLVCRCGVQALPAPGGKGCVCGWGGGRVFVCRCVCVRVFDGGRGSRDSVGGVGVGGTACLNARGVGGGGPSVCWSQAPLQAAPLKRHAPPADRTARHGAARRGAGRTGKHHWPRRLEARQRRGGLALCMPRVADARRLGAIRGGAVGEGGGERRPVRSLCAALCKGRG